MHEHDGVDDHYGFVHDHTKLLDGNGHADADDYVMDSSMEGDGDDDDDDDDGDYDYAPAA